MNIKRLGDDLVDLSAVTQSAPLKWTWSFSLLVEFSSWCEWRGHRNVLPDISMSISLGSTEKHKELIHWLSELNHVLSIKLAAAKQLKDMPITKCCYKEYSQHLLKSVPLQHTLWQVSVPYTSWIICKFDSVGKLWSNQSRASTFPQNGRQELLEKNEITFFPALGLQWEECNCCSYTILYFNTGTFF